MRLENKGLMGEYYRQEREKYPDLTFAQFEEALRSPWRMLREEMTSGRLGSVRFRYLGLFQVYAGRARYMLETIGNRERCGILTRERHDRLKAMLEGHLGIGDEGENGNERE